MKVFVVNFRYIEESGPYTVWKISDSGPECIPMKQVFQTDNTTVNIYPCLRI